MADAKAKGCPKKLMGFDQEEEARLRPPGPEPRSLSSPKLLSSVLEPWALRL